MARKWTEEEVDFLRKNYWKTDLKKEVVGWEYLQKNLNRTKNSISLKARRLGLCGKSPTTWSAKDLDYLEDNYGFISVEGIAKKLNRSREAVRQKAQLLGLCSKEGTRYFYRIYFPDINLYKVGISSKPKKRFSQFGHKVEVLELLLMDSRSDARYKEQTELDKLPLINTGLLTSGNTETYKL